MNLNKRQQSVIPPIPDTGLYSFKNEHDACGVGMVANLTNEAQHSIVEKGITILKRLMHRGATGSDSQTGDGAGILVQIPDDFFRKAVSFHLPKAGQYGVAMIFDAEENATNFSKIIQQEGATFLGIREVPIHPEFIGIAAQQCCPKISQCFIGGEMFATQDEFERKLLVIRRSLEKAFPTSTFCSCSSKSIVYKGLLLATQIDRFYPDLHDQDFKSAFATVHQRYSTNTFPTWSLAHPFRYLAHNGEINTLRGNINQLRSREPYLKSDLLGEDLGKILPLPTDNQSDSACLDQMLELLVMSGRSLPHAMLMLMPQAWGKKYHLGRDVRGFFEYHSALMEPWDGPAAVVFSDGTNVGAMLDRNGLRPARYTLTKDQIFVLASETGVLDIPANEVIKKGRLKPGEMVYCDLEHHRLQYDAEIKNQIARQKPYRRWVDDNKIMVNGLFASIMPATVSDDFEYRQRLFGWTKEDVELIVKPMAETGREPTGSMGNDSALAVLSQKPKMLYGYFKQLFAQVTNPPIDPIREELVMSLTTYIGNQANILQEGPEHARLIKLDRPVLTEEDINRLKLIKNENFKSIIIPIAWKNNLEQALEQLIINCVKAVNDGFRILILSDKNLAKDELPIPALLATTAVNQALVKAGLRPPVGLIIQTGEVREIMHYALLLGFGATAINPYLTLESITQFVQRNEIFLDSAEATEKYIYAVDKGLLKVMSKMGISTLRSYRSAQIFEAVGLSLDFINHYFPGTASRIGGIGIKDVEYEVRLRYEQAKEQHHLDLGGDYRFRLNGENHLWTPQTLTFFRQAVQNNDVEKYRQYAELINNQSTHLCTLRGLFELIEAKQPIPLEEVESVESIIKHFVSGAMSLGSLSPEAHEAIAIAMNRLGAMSNCGEGGEDSERQILGPNGEVRQSSIRQIASGRFGVTIDYLANAKELQIKMAQGAKPGEGGQLPGNKVDKAIAKVRHSTEGVTLISPPPHHDIYSIEDLAQLIFDLRNANSKARISVKLVSEVGVGTIAAGVAKARADVILISGHDGGTGASPLTSIKHAGLPWELGVAETQQTLVLNHLRGQVRLQTDGQLKTGRDVVIAALLGAEEFGFATTLLVCLGCVMMRKCHENSCPVGVATQDPQLRKCFHGKPEYIENFLRMLAQEVREYLARLGLHSIQEAVGRSDLIKMNKAIDYYKLKNLDFSKILQPVRNGDVCYTEGWKETVKIYDEIHFLPQVQDALKNGTPTIIQCILANEDRTVGTRLSEAITLQYGAKGLPPNTITIKMTGCAGQSLGAFLAPGVTLQLKGEANDFVGKGISGGKITIAPPENATYKAEQNVIAGNVIGYGGTSGKIFLNGQAGERFAIRNSGVNMVAEGIGDHGCEYMTGGRVVILGPVGMNFAAGMTGGIAYVLDQDNDFDLKCNVETVDLESILQGSEDESELKSILLEYIAETKSAKAIHILESWEEYRSSFVKVFPVEYKQLLMAGRLGRED